jgi:hypothetical protein
MIFCYLNFFCLELTAEIRLQQKLDSRRNDQLDSNYKNIS